MYALRIFALLTVAAVAHGFAHYTYWDHYYKQKAIEMAEEAEELRIAEEKRIAEEERIAEEQRAAEAAEAERRAAEERKAAAERQADEEGKANLVNTGPRLYYYESTLTWNSSAEFCKEIDSALCSYEQLCPQILNGRHFVHDVIPGNHWIAIKDHEWLEIGTAYGTPCVTHESLGRSAMWGNLIEATPWRGYVSCCKETEEMEPAVSFRYIGKTATYHSSRDYCVHQGRRLCYSSEVCSRNKPVYGVIPGEHWIPVRDRQNEWIQIGTDHNLTCRHHGVTYTPPSWGQRTDASSLDHVGYVYCCK